MGNHGHGVYVSLLEGFFLVIAYAPFSYSPSVLLLMFTTFLVTILYNNTFA